MKSVSVGHQFHGHCGSEALQRELKEKIKIKSVSAGQHFPVSEALQRELKQKRTVSVEQ
jgi:ADP-ribose pyrophosphatase YjhB (NUDIX family)